MKNDEMFSSETVNQAVLDALTNKKTVLKSLRLAVHKKGDRRPGEITQEILNLDLYMRVRLLCLSDEDSTASTRVTNQILKLAGLSEEEAWEAARNNTWEEIFVGSMSEVLFGDDTVESMFFIATTKDKLDGAAVIAFPEFFKAFCEAHETTGVCVLPSSTEELLLIPETSDMFSYEDMAELVSSVNASGVTDPRIALDAVSYRYDSATNTFSIAAMAM